MNRTMLFHRALLLCLVFILVVPVLPIQAQAPERSEAFVYALTAYDGQAYQSSFVPPNVDTVYLLAGAESVLAARDTLIYHWDITNRFEADWTAKNVFIDGTLEVSRLGALVAAAEPTDYVVQYDTEDVYDTRALITGAQAEAAYRNFQNLQQEYRDATYLYYQMREIYQDTVDKIIASGQVIDAADFPEPPQQPAPLTLYSSEIARGYVLDLPAGEYTLSLRAADGTVVAGSRRNLVVFEVLEEGIAYTIMPETRWSRPSESVIEGSTIYTPPGNTLYLQPFEQKKFNDYAYAHMLDPQDVSSRRDKERWVSYDPFRPAELIVSGGNRQTYAMEGFKIVQLAGSGLGYEVRAFDPETMDSISFEGFKIALEPGNEALRIRLIDERGNAVAGSDREVRTLYTQRANSLYVISILPLLAGAAALFVRSRSIKRIKVEG